VTLNQSLEFPGDMRFDGKHVAVGDQRAGTIYQLAISGSLATRAGSTVLTGASDPVGFWIERTKVIAADAGRGDVIVTNYPSGGATQRTLYDQDAPIGAVISPNADRP
jgi:hypothetical protein